MLTVECEAVLPGHLSTSLQHFSWWHIPWGMVMRMCHVHAVHCIQLTPVKLAPVLAQATHSGFWHLDFGSQFDASSSSEPVKYVSHIMKDGAGCVMTGEGRTAEVSHFAAYIHACLCDMSYGMCDINMSHWSKVSCSLAMLQHIHVVSPCCTVRHGWVCLLLGASQWVPVTRLPYPWPCMPSLNLVACHRLRSVLHTA